MAASLRALARRLRPGIRDDLKGAVRALASRSASRWCLNLAYRALSPQQKSHFQGHYRTLFRGEPRPIEEGVWTVRFAGRTIRLPLTPEGAWLEWDAAVSILGHEVEIKVTYETLIRCGPRPAVFFDVGASYGLHSLLFLAHGIRAVSFEPNPECHAYLRRACALNGVTCDIRPVALADREGPARLWYPDGETWLGTTDARARDRLGAGERIRTRTVQRTTIDRFVAESGCWPDLIKVDTEGSERQVLQGGLDTLRARRPRVIFESFRDSGRDELHALLESAGCGIADLPLRPGVRPRRLDRQAFAASRNSNFVALATRVFDGGHRE